MNSEFLLIPDEVSEIYNCDCEEYSEETDSDESDDNCQQFLYGCGYSDDDYKDFYNTNINVKNIEEMSKTPIDSDQLLEIAGQQCPIMVYSDLESINDINQLISDEQPCIFILYEFNKSTNENGGNNIEGHWCGLAKFDDNSITFFDSFGGLPDSPLRHIPEGYKEQFGETKRKLMELLKNSDVDYIEWNSHRFQNKDYQTCGRHVGYFMRCMNRVDEDSPILHNTDDYFDYIKNIQKEYYPDLNLDYVICELTKGI